MPLPDVYDRRRAFNLAHEPWIRAYRLDGTPEHLGLRDLLLGAHELADIDCALPTSRPALLRVLAAFTYRVSGLDDLTLSAAQWRIRRAAAVKAGRFDAAAVADYLDRCSDGLWLFGDRPFLQDVRLYDDCADNATGTTTVNKLIASRPSGSNPAWFGHHQDADKDQIAAGDAVEHLIATRMTAAGGRATTRLGNGSSQTGPLRGVVSYHPLGKSLFHTLMLHLVYPDLLVAAAHDAGTGDAGADVAPWETAVLPGLGDPMVTRGPLEALTITNRAVLLLTTDGRHAHDAISTWGRAKSEAPLPPDPYVALEPVKTGTVKRVSATMNSAAWRELPAALMSLAAGQRGAIRQPLVVSGLYGDDEVQDVAGDISFEVLGPVQDRAQDKSNDMLVSRSPALNALLEDPYALNIAVACLEQATRQHARVRKALDDVRKGPRRADGSGEPAVLSTAESARFAGAKADAALRYWPTAEQLLWEHVRSLTYPTTAYLNLARSVYDHVTVALATDIRYATHVALARP